MENLFESSIIKGFIFSAYGELGPQPVYTWPISVAINPHKSTSKPSYCWVETLYISKGGQSELVPIIIEPRC